MPQRNVSKKWHVMRCRGNVPAELFNFTINPLFAISFTITPFAPCAPIRLTVG